MDPITSVVDISRLRLVRVADDQRAITTPSTFIKNGAGWSTVVKQTMEMELVRVVGGEHSLIERGRRQAHRSQTVNVNHDAGIGGAEIVFRDSTSVIAGRQKRAVVGGQDIGSEDGKCTDLSARTIPESRSVSARMLNVGRRFRRGQSAHLSAKVVGIVILGRHRSDLDVELRRQRNT